MDTALTWNYIGPYLAALSNGSRVPSFSRVNLAVDYSGIHDLTVYAKVNNLFDRYPPFDPIFLNFPGQPPYDPSLYNNEGRYAEVGLRYKFL